MFSLLVLLAALLFSFWLLYVVVIIAEWISRIRKMSLWEEYFCGYLGHKGFGFSGEISGFSFQMGLDQFKGVVAEI